MDNTFLKLFESKINDDPKLILNLVYDYLISEDEFAETFDEEKELTINLRESLRSWVKEKGGKPNKIFVSILGQGSKNRRLVSFVSKPA